MLLMLVLHTLIISNKSATPIMILCDLYCALTLLEIKVTVEVFKMVYHLLDDL